MLIAALETSTTVDSMRVAFKTDVPAKAFLLMLDGNSQPSDVYPMVDDIAGTGHSVDIIGLIPDTDYNYTLALVDQNGAEWPFSNQPTLRTKPVDPLAPPKIRLDLNGPNAVDPGRKLYLRFRSVVLAGEKNQHLTITDIANLPPDSKFRLYTGYGNGEPCLVNAQGQDWIYGGNDSQCGAYLETAATTPAGPYDFRIRATAENGATAERSYGVKVGGPTPPPEPPSGIPGLEAWEAAMTTLADKWSAWAMANNCSFGVESEPWYYDGGRVLLQCHGYIGKPEYKQAALRILDQYANYVIAAGGKIPGWRKFPHGLSMAIEAGLDDDSEKFERALTLLYDSCNDWNLNGASLVRGDCADVHFIRELAYAIDCLTVGLDIDLGVTPWLEEAISPALGMIDQMVNKQVMDQPFMGGLLAEALINYDLEFPEPDDRISSALMALADHYIKEAVRPEGSIAYSLLPKPRTYITELNNMLIPLFTWLWRHTGIAAYRDVADQCFQVSTQGDLAYSGKIFCQNYRWSFKHVEWRSQGVI